MSELFKSELRRTFTRNPFDTYAYAQPLPEDDDEALEGRAIVENWLSRSWRSGRHGISWLVASVCLSTFPDAAGPSGAAAVVGTGCLLLALGEYGAASLQVTFMEPFVTPPVGTANQYHRAMETGEPLPLIHIRNRGQEY